MTARRLPAVALAVTCALGILVAGVAQGRVGGDVPPPTPVPPDGRPSAFPSVLATPSNALTTPNIGAQAALLADLHTGEILFERAADGRRPIASITKVMTALVALEETDLDDVVTVTREAVFGPRDYGYSSTLGLRVGERRTVEDLLYALLLGSANDAAVALAVHVDGSQAAFLERMDRRAAALGMRRTHFASVHGLDDSGRSTARDVLRMVRAAMSHPPFNRITAARFHTIAGPGPDRVIQNRNVLLWLYDGAFGTKTGTTVGAGPCVVAAAARNGRRLVSIVLHAEGEPFSDAATLLNHGFEGFTRTTIVETGEALGPVQLRGGSVEAAAGATLEALVPTVAMDRIEATIEVDPRAAFPPAPGERIGWIRFATTDPNDPLGRVPLVVSTVPLPTEEDSPWWWGALTAVGEALRDVVSGLAG